MIGRTPVSVIAGFLGVGKTTALRHLLAGHPGEERWAVLVNEIGEVGIDGAVLASGAGWEVREIPGGCICCSANVPLRVTLTRMVRELRPDRILIEPTGLARPSAVLDMVRSAGLTEALSPRATITLVDPRHLDDPRYTGNDTWQAQVAAADVLVANKADRCPPEAIAAFHRFAAGLEPPKAIVAVTEQGRLDPAWLELRGPAEVARFVGGLEAPVHLEGGGEVLQPAPGRYPRADADGATCGFVFPPERIFERWPLEDALQSLVHPSEVLPAGAWRVKGIFRTDRAWLLADATPDAIRWLPVDHRRDSRVEIIAPPSPPPDWDAVQALFDGALRPTTPSP